MSNIDLVIEERSRDIGGFLVGRLLPFRKKRMVGPFIFIDHMGPSEIGPGRYIDIGQHPHIGLSTLTYLFQGEIFHQDSIGSRQFIKPGSVNLMTAGRGVVHTERTPDSLRDGQTHTVHGYQIWVALPKELEDIDPSFHHIPHADLPVWQEGTTSFVLVAGEAYGYRSPVPVHSRLFMIDIQTEKPKVIDTGNHLFGEIGFCVVKGHVEIEGTKVEQGNLLVSKALNTCQLSMGPNTHMLIFGGEPLKGPKHIYWNFVSSDKSKIEIAKQRWANRTFKLIPGDTSYIPLPKF